MTISYAALVDFRIEVAYAEHKTAGVVEQDDISRAYYRFY